MTLIVVFISLLFVDSLVSRLLSKSIITAPILFTVGGLLLVTIFPGVPELHIDREKLLMLAEIGLVLLLFTDATHINLDKLRSREHISLRLLSIGMLLTILFGSYNFV